MSFINPEELARLYQNHAMFKQLVDAMEEGLVNGRVSQRLLVWALVLATERAEMRRIVEARESAVDLREGWHGHENQAIEEQEDGGEAPSAWRVP